MIITIIFKTIRAFRRGPGVGNLTPLMWSLMFRPRNETRSSVTDRSNDEIPPLA